MSPCEQVYANERLEKELEFRKDAHNMAEMQNAEQLGEIKTLERSLVHERLMREEAEGYNMTLSKQNGILESHIKQYKSKLKDACADLGRLQGELNTMKLAGDELIQKNIALSKGICDCWWCRVKRFFKGVA